MTWTGITPSSDKILGEDFGILRSGQVKQAVGQALGGGGIGGLIDTGASAKACVEAIETLESVRSSDYLSLSVMLEKAVTDESSRSCVLF